MEKKPHGTKPLRFAQCRERQSAIIQLILISSSLPWSRVKDTNDIKKAKAQLDRDHYGLENVKERILNYQPSRIMTKKNPQAILCFVGPPGVGKHPWRGRSAALGKQFVKHSLGGVRTRRKSAVIADLPRALRTHPSRDEAAGVANGLPARRDRQTLERLQTTRRRFA